MFTFGIKFNGFFIGPFDVVFVMKSLLPFMLGFLESLSFQILNAEWVVSFKMCDLIGLANTR